MAEFKLWTGESVYHSPEFHADRGVADHINEPGHRERLVEALTRVGELVSIHPSIKTLSDWGAGNGGLLHEIGRQYPQLKCWGYDLMPKNVEYARAIYDADVTYQDFTDLKSNCRAGDVMILTEILEHLVRPHNLLLHLRLAAPAKPAFQPLPRFVIASSPAFETPDKHYEYHQWAWTGESYGKMFERAGWQVRMHYVIAACGTQFVIAERHG